jgi:putative transposase
VKLRGEVRWLGEHYQASQQRFCELMQIAVSSYRYHSTRSDAALRERLVELARKKPRWGYRRLHILLHASGEQVNHKRVFRVSGKQDWQCAEKRASGWCGRVRRSRR